MSASVINGNDEFIFMLNAIILSNIILISLMNEYTITCGALAPLNEFVLFRFSGTSEIH